jgi:LacI family transcriptional regulator
MDRAYSYALRVTRGVRMYAQPPRDWALLCWSLAAAGWDVLEGWGADGVIAALGTTADVEAARACGKPVVNVSSSLAHAGVPSVLVDNTAVGRMAARHLVECGVRSCACIAARGGVHGLRVQGFRQVAREQGLEALPLASPRHRLHIDHRFAAALHELAPPVGLFLAEDNAAEQVIRGCRLAGLEVPGDVLVLGAGDDALDCDMVAPALSSVHIPWERIGYEAARLLELLATGHPEPAAPILIPPTGVTTRGTTRRRGYDDPEVAAALATIHATRRQPATVTEVIAAAGVSRRVLDRKMQVACGRTVSAEIVHTQLQRAKALLQDTELPLDGIARKAGFSSAAHLCVTFKRHLGMTPAGYRRLAR